MRSVTDFQLMGDRVAVGLFEGTVQLRWMVDGCDGGPVQVFATRFAGQETAAELRAIADHLEALPWIDDGTVAASGGRVAGVPDGMAQRVGEGW